MMPRIARALLLAVACGAATVSALAQEAPSAATVRSAMAAVVQVQAESCNGASAKGTGFVWREARYVVTALHVVAGCSSVRVFFERPQMLPLRKATIARVSRALDLALLEIEDPPAAATPLRESRTDVTSDRHYRAIGFSEQQPSMGDITARISNGRAALTGILGQAELAELRRVGININRVVVRFETGLNPGMSGGPVIDAAGAVVAVAAGGLRTMPVPPSFAWPASDLDLLLRSTESPSAVAAIRPSTLTSAVQPSNAGASVLCGAVEFKLVARYSFAESARQADDPIRVEAVVQASRRPREEIDRLVFDIWRDTLSGATVFVPEGAQLRAVGDYCEAVKSGIVKQRVWGQTAGDFVGLHNASLVFEQRFAGPYGTALQPDFILTTPGPQSGVGRSDGALFNRKGVVAGFPGLPLPTVTAHLFETLMVRNNTLVAVLIANEGYLPLLQQQGCLINPALPACSQAVELMKEWTAFVLAAQLTTFPRY